MSTKVMFNRAATIKSFANVQQSFLNAVSRSRSRDDDDGTVRFTYTGQSTRDIPRDITHLKIDPSVRVIGECMIDFTIVY